MHVYKNGFSMDMITRKVRMLGKRHFCNVVFTLALLLPAAAYAAEEGCPPEAISELHAAATRDQGLSVQEVSALLNKTPASCSSDRLAQSLILTVFVDAAGALTPPANERDALLYNALKTAFAIGRNYSSLEDERRVVNPVGWTTWSERYAYQILMLLLVGDYIDFGRNDLFYKAEAQEDVGCGLYPEREALTLSLNAVGAADKLDARVKYLGDYCTFSNRELTGYIAKYWQARLLYKFENDPIPRSKKIALFDHFFDMHMDGQNKSSVFSAEELERVKDCRESVLSSVFDCR